MSNKNEISGKRKLWEIINPLIFIMVCIIIGGMIASSAAMMIASAMNKAIYEIYDIYFRASLIAELAAFAAVIIIKRKSIIYDKFKYEHKPNCWPVYKIIFGIIAGVAYSMIINFLIAISGLQQLFPAYNNSASMQFSGQPIVLLIITVVILGPIAEEIIFRWMIFGRIRYYFGSKWAILFSSLMFGLYHMNMVQFVFATLLGFGFSYLYDKSGNIYITIIAHMIINMIGIIGYF